MCRKEKNGNKTDRARGLRMNIHTAREEGCLDRGTSCTFQHGSRDM